MTSRDERVTDHTARHGANRPAGGHMPWWGARGAAAVAVVAAAVRVASSAGAADHWVTVPVLGAYPWVVLASAIAAVAATIGAARGQHDLRRPAAALAAAAVVGSVIVVPRAVARPQPQAAGQQVTVGVINVRRGLASADRIAQVVENAGVDVLVAIELTDQLDEDLRRAGLAVALPRSVVAPTRSAAGGGVYATTELAPLRSPADGGDTPDVAVILPGGGSLEVTTTHPVPPIGPRRTQLWLRGLDRIGGATDRQPALVVGDLNATLDHGALREVLQRGWRDAAREAGAGLSVTYDGIVDGSPGVPMAIDHILVSPSIAVTDVQTYDVEGTDHRMLVADLTLPAGA